MTVEYDGAGSPVGLTFAPETLVGPRSFRLPAKVDGVMSALKKQSGKGGRVSRSMADRAHASRVAWRILKDWIEAQLALVEAELVEVDEVLLPYMLERTGRTLFEAWREQQALPGPTD